MQQEEGQLDCLMIESNLENIHTMIETLNPYNVRIRIAKTKAFGLKLIDKQMPNIILIGQLQEGEKDITEIEEKAQEAMIILLPIHKVTLLHILRREKQYLKQQITAQKAEEALEEFCRSVSHDLRSPVNMVKELSSILQMEFKETLPQDGQQLLAHLVNKSEDLSEMLERLLLLSRVGRKTLLCEEVDLNKVFQEVFEKLHPKNIKLKLEALPSIMGDQELLVLLSEELLQNAIKFTAPMEVGEIYITGYKEEENSIILIKDNGVGFDMQYAHKLFKVFERLHSKESFEGCGVGLAIAKKIIIRHGGEITITSEIKKGTQIKLCIPNSYFNDGLNRNFTLN